MVAITICCSQSVKTWTRALEAQDLRMARDMAAFNAMRRFFTLRNVFVNRAKDGLGKVVDMKMRWFRAPWLKVEAWEGPRWNAGTWGSSGLSMTLNNLTCIHPRGYKVFSTQNTNKLFASR
jgi:hypothetical protein